MGWHSYNSGFLGAAGTLGCFLQGLLRTRQTWPQGSEKVVRCRGEQHISRTSGIIPKRLYELEKGGSGKAMVSLPPSQPMWHSAGGAKRPEDSCHVSSCPPGESCWVSHPFGDALGQCHVSCSHLSRTVVQFTLSLWWRWAASPQLPGCHPASFRQPVSPPGPRTSVVPGDAYCALGSHPLSQALGTTLCSLAGRGIPPALLAPPFPHSDLQNGAQGLPLTSHAPLPGCHRGSSLPGLCSSPFPPARATRLLWRRCWFNAAAQPGASPVTTRYLG